MYDADEHSLNVMKVLDIILSKKYVFLLFSNKAPVTRATVILTWEIYIKMLDFIAHGKQSFYIYKVDQKQAVRLQACYEPKNHNFSQP